VEQTTGVFCHRVVAAAVSATLGRLLRANRDCDVVVVPDLRFAAVKTFLDAVYRAMADGTECE
jgi:hypothetical protein